MDEAQRRCSEWLSIAVLKIVATELERATIIGHLGKVLEHFTESLQGR
ncbi:hypothetical protein MKK68_00045 [Methylobacterium sp. E-016]|jgi:hypothetical protein|nr:hypothetical protein [Methylobacterium sp. E-016]MCJ2074062.1 hypothetical protein [Methylobacterium sp. E-016]